MKLIELLMTTPAIYILFGVLVWILTYIVKSPIKKRTDLIKDEKKRKIANKWILAIPFFLSLLVVVIYTGIKTGMWFNGWEDMLSKAFLIAVFAITWYNVFEGIRGKKSEYEVTDEGIVLFNVIQAYAKDKSKVTLLLDQCKKNINNEGFTIAETIKGFLPPDTDLAVFDTIVAMIEKYFNPKNEKLIKLPQGKEVV